jgi:hypothetical protein
MAVRLLIGRVDRLASVDASAIRYFFDIRHYGPALDEIARTLAHHTIAITGQERADMLV